MRARLAQPVERKALNLVVVGSSPTVGVLSRFDPVIVRDVTDGFRCYGLYMLASWSSGMIPASGAGGPGFDPRRSPFSAKLICKSGDIFRKICWQSPFSFTNDAELNLRIRVFLDSAAWTLALAPIVFNSVCGLVVRIAGFHPAGPGSIPGSRIL